MAVTFNEAAHTYTSDKGERYISVTTLIKKYVPPFDENYWSTYKAMKAVLEGKGEWADYKKKAGGWENVVTYVREIDKSFPYRTEVLEKKREILRMWKDNKESAASTGTAFHKMKESSEKEKVIYGPDMTELPVLSGDPIKDRSVTDSGVYTELLIYNDELQIAGQADWVMRLKDHVSIKDYKTSKSIERKAFQNEVLLPPVSHLPNANLFIYGLQLSLYAWLLEQVGYKVDKLMIEHVDRRTFKTIENIPVNYYKAEIESIVEHYRAEKERKKVYH